MTWTPASAAVAGAAAGTLVGWLSRLALKRTLLSADTVFYGAFFCGLFGRLGLLAASVWLLREEKYIIIVLFAGTMVLAQTIFEAFPLKRDGIKRDSRAPRS